MRNIPFSPLVLYPGALSRLKKRPAIQQPKATELPGQVSPPSGGSEPCAFRRGKGAKPPWFSLFLPPQIVFLPGAPKGADELESLAA